MPKDLQGAVIAQMDAQQKRPVLLFEIGLSSTLRFAAYMTNVTFPAAGNVYTAKAIELASVKQTLEGQIGRVTIKFDNVTSDMYAYAHNEDFRGASLIIKRVYLDALGNALNYNEVFNGFLESPSGIDRHWLTVKATTGKPLGRKTLDFSYQKMCPWIFGGTECNTDGLANLAVLTDSGTADSGSTTTLVDNGLTQANDFWNYGEVEVTKGGVTYYRKVKDFSSANDRITFDVELPFSVDGTCTYVVYKGCDQTWDTCTGVNAWGPSADNKANFGGCIHVSRPGDIAPRVYGGWRGKTEEVRRWLHGDPVEPDNTQSEDVFVARCYGKTLIGGNKIRFNEANATDLRIIIGHCLGETDGIQTWYVNDIDFDVLTGAHSKTEYTGTRVQAADGRFAVRPSAYRGIAYTAFTFIKNDSQVGSDPAIKVLMQGLKCTPIGGGAKAYTTNNAIIQYDWYLDVEGYGGGDLDADAFNSLGALCDEVPAGGILPRYSFNYNFKTNVAINDAKKLLWASFNGKIIMSQGKLKPVWDSSQMADGAGGLTAKTVSHAFDEDDIVKDTIKWSQPEKYNVVRIHFYDQTENFKKTSVEVKDPNDIAINGEILYEQKCWYIVDAELARRRAKYKFNKSKYEDYEVEFSAFSGGGDLEEYDLVTVTHSLPAWTAKQFYVVDKEEDPHGRMKFTLMAYFSGIYDDTEVGEQPGYEPDLPNPYDPPTDSTGITASLVATGSTFNFDSVKVSFTPPADYPFYSYSEIYASNDDATYYLVGQSSGGDFVFNGMGSIYQPGETCYIKLVNVNEAGIPAAMPGAADTSVVITGYIRFGSYYVGPYDLWGGNAAIGNAATKVVIGNLDGTAKIALGPTADAITYAGVQPGFFVDGDGYMRVGSATHGLKFDPASGVLDVPTKVRVGSGTYIDIDGANARIRSSNYVSGIAGAGFNLDPDWLEVGNIAARGVIRTAVFQADVVSAVGGNLMVRPADVLDTTMTALDADDLTIEGNETFAVGDFLRIKTGLDDEWLEVTGVGGAPTYAVTRDKAAAYGADDNPLWEAGASVVNYGASGDGGVYLTASESNAPYVSIFTHAGAPWTTITTHMRMGNLNGFLDYAEDRYGIAIGETDAHLKYDPTTGLRVVGTVGIKTPHTFPDNANLIGYWPFDEGTGTTTTADKSGNGNDGTLEGTMTEDDWIAGVFSTGLDFDGVDDRVDCGTAAPLDDIGISDFSLSFWMKSGGSIKDAGRLFTKHQSADDNIWLQSSGTNNRVRLEVEVATVNNGADFSTTNQPFTEELNHVVLTINRTSDLALLYINGVKDATEIDVSAWPADWSNTGNVAWGASSGGGVGYLGMLDECRIYDSVLTQPEVLALYHYPMFYAGDGDQEFMRYDPGSGLTISTSQANAITIKSGGDISIESGGDINFVGSSYTTGLNSNATGAICYFQPTTADVVTFNLGLNTYPFASVDIWAHDSIGISVDPDANNRSAVLLDRIGEIGGSARIVLVLKDEGVSKSIVATFDDSAPFYYLGPDTDGECDLGRTAVRWATVYCDDIEITNGVPQGSLKTSTGEVSVTAGSGMYTLPGGEYGFYPQTKLNNTNSRAVKAYMLFVTASIGATYVTRIYLETNGDTLYAQQRYVTSSGEVFWIFILRSTVDESIELEDNDGIPFTYNRPKGSIISVWQAPDHPCFGNGGKPNIVPHPFLDFDENTQEIIVVNPLKEQIAEMQTKCPSGSEDMPDRSLVQVIEEDYNLDEITETTWPDIPVTVGLPPDWEEKPTGSKIVPIKKIIPKPNYIKTAALKLKTI